MSYLAGIYIYPVKSLDQQAISQARVLPGGALEGDRQFALFDAAGKYVNGKNQARVHPLRSHYDAESRTLRLRQPDQDWRTWHVDHDHPKLEEWLGEYFGFAVTFKENAAGGFPDDPDAPGPTVISTATLAEVASWFGGLSLEQTRVRFRTNLEIGAVVPFWEDRLYGPKPPRDSPPARVTFQIGDVRIDGNNPCQRCRVPPRDPYTGEGTPDFSPIFRKKREETLPAWAARSRFDHFYRLAVNTVVPLSEAGKILHVGDEIRVIGPSA